MLVALKTVSLVAIVFATEAVAAPVANPAAAASTGHGTHVPEPSADQTAVPTPPTQGSPGADSGEAADPGSAGEHASGSDLRTTSDVPKDWQLLQDLRQRRETLDSRNAVLDAREAALAAAEADLSVRLSKLEKLKADLEALEAGRQGRQEESWRSMVKLYEAMKPVEAATIFNVLDMRVLLPLLDRMNERKAAVVMGDMDPERARLATQLLVQYRAKRDSVAGGADKPTVQASGSGAG